MHPNGEQVVGVAERKKIADDTPLAMIDSAVERSETEGPYPVTFVSQDVDYVLGGDGGEVTAADGLLSGAIVLMTLGDSAAYLHAQGVNMKSFVDPSGDPMVLMSKSVAIMGEPGHLRDSPRTKKTLTKNEREKQEDWFKGNAMDRNGVFVFVPSADNGDIYTIQLAYDSKQGLYRSDRKVRLGSVDGVSLENRQWKLDGVTAAQMAPKRATKFKPSSYAEDVGRAFKLVFTEPSRAWGGAETVHVTIVGATIAVVVALLLALLFAAGSSSGGQRMRERFRGGGDDDDE